MIGSIMHTSVGIFQDYIIHNKQIAEDQCPFVPYIGEQGLRLAGRECQRLVIARALQKNAPTVIFDEPPANLDPSTESQVLEALSESMLRKNSLLIKHCLIGLKMLIQLVMDHGQIVKHDSHDQLIENNGPYCCLWDLQNQIMVEVEDANI